MTSYVFTLEPEVVLREKIIFFKNQVKKIAGPQLYLEDEPHLTIYLGNFQSVESFEARLGAIAQATKKFSVAIEDWLLFRGDIITKRDTLALGLSAACLPLLKELQAEVISVLQSFRGLELLQRYKNLSGFFTGALKQNLDLYGYPFVGEIWKPHFTIASLEKEFFEPVWRTLREHCPGGVYGLEALKVYELDQATEALTCKKRFSLA